VTTLEYASPLAKEFDPELGSGSHDDPARM
jgi:hypothetical protein